MINNIFFYYTAPYISELQNGACHLELIIHAHGTRAAPKNALEEFDVH